MAADATRLIELMAQTTMTLDGIVRELGGPLEAAYAGLGKGERRRKVNDELKRVVQTLDADLLEISRLAKTWAIWKSADGKMVNDACYRIWPLRIALDENKAYLVALDSKMKVRINGTAKSLNELDERLQVALRIWQAESRYGWNDKQLNEKAGLTGHVGKIKRCQNQCAPETLAKLYWVLGISDSDQLPDLPLAADVQKMRTQLVEVTGQLNEHNLRIALQQTNALLAYQRSVGRPSQAGQIEQDPTKY